MYERPCFSTSFWELCTPLFHFTVLRGVQSKVPLIFYFQGGFGFTPDSELGNHSGGAQSAIWGYGDWKRGGRVQDKHPPNVLSMGPYKYFMASGFFLGGAHQLCPGVIPNSALSVITPGGAWGPNGMMGIQPGSVMCRQTSYLPYCCSGSCNWQFLQQVLLKRTL